jgi:hypothetical protein
MWFENFIHVFAAIKFDYFLIELKPRRKLNRKSSLKFWLIIIFFLTNVDNDDIMINLCITL